MRTNPFLWILACSASSAPSQEPSVDDRLRRLEETVRRQQEEIASLRTGTAGGAVAAGYDGGFFVASPDGAYRFTLEGLLQVNANLFERGLEGRETEVFLRRMRFEFGGEFEKRWLFHVEPKFTESGVDLEEAWVGADLGEGGPRLHVGRMKEPFSLEEMIPLRHVDFVNLSTLNQLVPAEQHGVTLIGRTAESRIEYGAAVYTGDGEEEFDSDRGGCARLVLRPFAASGEPLLEGLQFGGAATAGRAGQDLSGTEFLTEARVPLFAFEPGSRMDGRRVRLAAEAAWLSGPFALYGEAMRAEQRMEGAGGEADVRAGGGYAAASWVLTGEKKSFKGVRPERPFVPGKAGAGPGALQAAARISELRLDEDLVSAGLVAPSAFPGRVRSVDVGLNWYALYEARLKVHWLRTSFEEPIAAGGDARRSEDALLLQFQVNF
ncbi:MAG TPA: porin [Planctomycetota bacterium]|nr:porin [Planctomycetota bacterium]